MLVGSPISYLFVINGNFRNIIVDNQLSIWNINTSGNNIGCNEYINLTFSKLLHNLVSLCWGHITEKNKWCIFCFQQSFMNPQSKILWIHENERLSHSQRVKNALDKLKLLFGLTLHVELLNMVEFGHTLLWIKSYHLSFIYDLWDSFVHLVITIFRSFKSSWEKQILGVCFFNSFEVCNSFNLFVVLLITKEVITLVKNNAFDCWDIKHLVFPLFLCQLVFETSMGCN